MKMLHCLPFVLFVQSVFAAAGTDEIRLRVAAGDYDRRESIVSFPFPGAADGVWLARSEENGSRLPVQAMPGGDAAFILPELEAGQTEVFLLENVREAPPELPWVEVLPENGRLRLSVQGEPAVYYQAEERELPREGLDPLLKRGGFLHPVVSPAGKVVSESYPEGHPHHQGIWSPWTKTVFEGRTPDFWNLPAGTGTVEPAGIDETWSGPVAGGFRARHRFVDTSLEESKVALDETWTVNLFQAGEGENAYRLFELALFQECASDSPLELPEYHYGGLGFRGRDEWMGAENAFYLTSEGETDRVKGHATRTRWTHVSGLLDGDRTGVAILGHPENFRAPQPVRIHPNEPFFCYAPSQLGDWAITPEEPYRARYRFAVMDGDPDVELIERLWNDFAFPVKAEIVE